MLFSRNTVEGVKFKTQSANIIYTIKRYSGTNYWYLDWGIPTYSDGSTKSDEYSLYDILRHLNAKTWKAVN